MPRRKKKSRSRVISRRELVPSDKKAGELVIKALENPSWDYRTAEGIAEESKTSVNAVSGFLKTDNRVRASVMLGPKGRQLYTLKSKKSRIRDILSAIRAMNSAKLGG